MVWLLSGLANLVLLSTMHIYNHCLLVTYWAIGMMSIWTRTFPVSVSFPDLSLGSLPLHESQKVFSSLKSSFVSLKVLVVFRYEL